MRIGLVGAGRIGAVHAKALLAQGAVEEVLIADVATAASTALAADLGAGATSIDTIAGLFSSGIDGIVITAATSAHAELVKAAVAAGLPTFCEKPIAPSVTETLEVLDVVGKSGVEVQVGFQRRFDPGFVAARDAVQGGDLGWIHSIRAGTLDKAPPPDAYIPLSGGIFRDCSIHDVDAIRWVTGREVTSVYAVGANHGSDAFRDAGDVDAAAALLTLEGDTFAMINGTRYNAAGYDVRLEILGSEGSISVGLDDRLPIRSVEPGVSFPTGVPWTIFMERFASAYTAEMQAFVQVVAGEIPSPCSVSDALKSAFVTEACELSRREGRPVNVSEVVAA